MVLSPADFKNILFLIAFETWTLTPGWNEAGGFEGKVLKNIFGPVRESNGTVLFREITVPIREIAVSFREKNSQTVFDSGF